MRFSRSASATWASRSNAGRCSPTFWSRSSSAILIACCRCDSLISASCSRRAVCSPTFFSLSSWATRTACSRVASRVPISRSLVALATWMARSRSASATPVWPFFSCSATSILACWMAVAAAFRPIASMYPLSSVMSVMFTLISTRPIFFSSGSSDFWMLSRNLSRSRLMSSIRIDAMTWRSWPKMMSAACCLIVLGPEAEQADGAFCIVSASVPMATVNTLGTFTRMFSIDSAPLSGTSIWIGSRLR